MRYFELALEDKMGKIKKKYFRGTKMPSLEEAGQIFKNDIDVKSANRIICVKAINQHVIPESATLLDIQEGTQVGFKLDAAAVVRDVQHALFETKGTVHTLEFVTWTGENNSFVVNKNGRDFRITVTEEKKC